MRERSAPPRTLSTALAVLLASVTVACTPGPGASGSDDRFIPAQTVPAPPVRHVRTPTPMPGADIAVDSRVSCSLVPGTGRSADPWVLMPVAGRRFGVTGCTGDGRTAWFVVLIQARTPRDPLPVTGAVRLVHTVADGPVTARFVDSTGAGVDSAVWGNALLTGRAVPLVSLGNPDVGVRFGAETTAAEFDVEIDLRR